MLERLQKILARYAIASRRASEELILAGKIRVNGKVAKLGDKADEEKDKIEILGKNLSGRTIPPPVKNSKEFFTPALLRRGGQFVYYLLNKPIGYLCSFRRRKDELLAIDLVPKFPRVWNVGRLDKDSSGLLILTNDGQLTQKLTHPKFEHEKEYLITVDRKITSSFLRGLKNGVKLTEGVAKADKFFEINEKQFTITLHQGWKRQIRRMCYALGYHIKDLKRIRIGQWKLGNLREGEWRKISND